LNGVNTEPGFSGLEGLHGNKTTEPGFIGFEALHGNKWQNRDLWDLKDCTEIKQLEKLYFRLILSIH